MGWSQCALSHVLMAMSWSLCAHDYGPAAPGGFFCFFIYGESISPYLRGIKEEHFFSVLVMSALSSG